MDKKGMSPLLATSLLIVFSVALGMVVINFGRAQLESNSKCSVDIGLKSVKLNGEDQICIDKDNSEIYFIVENGVNTVIKSLRMQVISEKKVYSQDLEGSKIDILSPLLKKVPYDLSLGKILKIKFIPKVNLYDKDLFCDKQAVVVENLRECKK